MKKEPEHRKLIKVLHSSSYFFGTGVPQFKICLNVFITFRYYGVINWNFFYFHIISANRPMSMNAIAAEIRSWSTPDVIYAVTGLEIRIWKWAVKWSPKIKYDQSLRSYGRSLNYDTKGVFEDRKKNIEFSKGTQANFFISIKHSSFKILLINYTAIV